MIPGHKQIQKELARLAFPEYSLLLISACILFWFVNVFTKYLNFARLSENLLPIFMLWFCSTFSSWDMNMHCTWCSERLSANPYWRPTCFCVFLNTMYVSRDKLTSTETRSWRVPFIFILSRFACTFLATYSEAVAIKHHLLPIILSGKYYLCIFERHYTSRLHWTAFLLT
jgi:hypothetical protein